MQLKQTKHSLLRSCVCGSDAAEKARNDDVHADEEQQQKTDDPRADMEVLPDVNARRHKQIDERQNDRAHGAVEKTDGIEPADLQRAADGRRDHRDEDDVFQRIQFFVAVGLDAFAFLRAAFAQQPAGEVMEDSVGTNPVAENPAEQQRRQNQQQAPQ